MCQIINSVAKLKPFVLSFYIMKNVLITGATSDMAVPLIKRLLNDNVIVYALSRSELKLEDELLKKTRLDLSDEFGINNYFISLNDVKFDAVIFFHGIAISSPVEFLSSIELNKQLSISLFSTLAILKNLRKRLTKTSKIITVSSMASYGIFPFLSPYEIAKSSVDTLLCSYEIETGIKTISVKPGVVSTKFWRTSVELNKDNFESFPFEYRYIGEFLKDNALKNENKGIKPDDVSNLIYRIMYLKNPKSSYDIGIDSKFTNFISKFKGRFLFGIIRKILRRRVKKYLNER